MATAAQVETRVTRGSRDLWRVGDALVLLGYSCVVLWTIRYHEKWADEAQAWLIARDLDLRTIWFHELRYEGSPGLWHTILWVAQHVFHLAYGALGYIGVLFAIAGAAVLVFLAPFPRFVRWPLAFTYVMVYQYAVIARPYTLLPLLAFTAAIFFKDRRHPERITAVLILLVLLTVHGAILAGCLGLTYLFDSVSTWNGFPQDAKRRFIGSAAALIMSFGFLIAILWPSSDVEEFAMRDEAAKIAESLHVIPPTPYMKLMSVITGAFADYVTLSIIFLAVLVAWFAMRRRLLVFLLPIGLLIGLYVKVHGYSHHHGTITIATITALWIAWPNSHELSSFSELERKFTQLMIAFLLLFCVIQIWDTTVVLRHEYLYPYSGAEDASRFIKSAVNARKPIMGYLYGIAGVQPYFDHNIFANMPSSFFHHGTPLYGTVFDLYEIQRIQPEYIVIFTEQPQLMAQSGILDKFVPLGYGLVHFSDGYLLYRQGVYVRQAYFILGHQEEKGQH